MITAHNAQAPGTGHSDSEGLKSPAANPKICQWLRTLKRVVPRVAPIVLLVGLTCWVGYVTVLVRNQLATLDTTVSEFLATVRPYPPSGDASTPAHDPSGAFPAHSMVPTEINQESENSEQMAQKIRKIEEKIDTVLEIMGSVNSRFGGMVAQSRMDPRQAFETLPNLNVPVLPNALSRMGTSIPETIPNVSNETRTDVNNILRHYANEARAALQLASDGGSLDRAEMDLIKRETRARAAGELRTLLPEESVRPNVSDGLHPGQPVSPSGHFASTEKLAAY